MGTPAASRAAARRVAGLVLGATAVGWAVGGCGDAGVPARAPDVTGTVSLTRPADGPVLAEPSDGYFEGMSLLRGDPVVVRDGDRLGGSALRDGDRVEVWIDGGCAESFPVQCTVVALRVGG